MKPALTKGELKEHFNNKIVGSQILKLVEANYESLTELFIHTIPNDLRLLIKALLKDRTRLTDLLFFVLKELYSKSDIVFRIDGNLLDSNSDRLTELYDRVCEIFGLTYDEFSFEDFYRFVVFTIRTITHFLMIMVFRSMGIDIEGDSNVSIDYGSLGTPGRIAKMWVCKDVHDLTEPLSGRFAIEPELVIFPARGSEIGKPVTVTLTLNAVCSHHLFRFGNEFRNDNSKVIISYIPDKFVIGLSKINRWVDWIARRGWLQEELTKTIGEKLKEKVKTEDVYVGLINLQHGCVSFRGKNDAFAYTTTEYYSGKYEDEQFRDSVIGKFLK